MIAYFNNWILYSNVNGQTVAAFNDMEGSHKHSAEKIRARYKREQVYESIHMKFKNNRTSMMIVFKVEKG